MNLSKEIILDRFERTEDRMAPYRVLAQEYEAMWRLDPGFTKTLKEMVMEGKERVVLPTPFNVVNLSQRLLATTPRINVIPNDTMDREAVENSEAAEKWLTALWSRINRDQGRNVMADAIWFALVRGRFAFEVKWVKQALPKLRQKTMLPLSIRALDPMNIGSFAGPRYTEWVYHTYEASLLEVVHKWPELKKAPVGSQLDLRLRDLDKKTGHGEDDEVTVIDYWYISEKDGSIWNAVLVEDEFAKPPMKTDYPELPIVVGRGDYGVNIGEEWDGLSVLHPLRGLWQYQCRLASQMATGLLWHFWPAVTLQNEFGADVSDIEITPGSTTPTPWGTRIEMHRIEPNVPLAQAVYSQVDEHVQQSTYPGVMYGQAPGELQAGYGVSLLSAAARNRIKNFAEALETAISHVNSMALALVEEMAGAEGVSISTLDERDSEKRTLKLTPKMVSGMYDNEVKITPNLPSDEQARITLGIRLADGKYISAQTLRDNFLDIKTPTDEQKRITLEEAMQSDELRSFRIRKAVEQYFGLDDALKMLYDTEFMPKAPEGMHWMQDYPDGPVRLMPDEKMQKQGPPEGGPGGPPPGGMPPEPPMGPGGPGGPIQPEAMQGPMGGNLQAPAMMGMMEPEMMGLPPGGDPALFAQMMGQGLPPQEELDLLGGMPPGA